jgi:hypothetical protein
MKHKRRQAQRVITMKVREEDGVDGARVHAHAPHMRQERRAAVQEQAAVDHHRPVVTVRGKRGPGAEEGQL